MNLFLSRLWLNLVKKPLNFIKYHLKTLLIIRKRLVKADPSEFIVSITMVHQGKYYGAFVVIPPEKQNMAHVRESTSGLANTVDERLKNYFMVLNESQLWQNFSLISGPLLKSRVLVPSPMEVSRLNWIISSSLLLGQVLSSPNHWQLFQVFSDMILPPRFIVVVLTTASAAVCSASATPSAGCTCWGHVLLLLGLPTGLRKSVL